MKNELLYETQADFEEAQGQSGNVTSITPGVANVVENNEVHYNKASDILKIFYNVEDIAQPTRIFTSDSVKTGLKYIIVGKERIDASDVTNEYQFTKTGINSIRFVYSDLRSIPESAFSGCTSLYSFKLPERVYRLNAYCFKETGVVYGVIPEHITSYGQAIFQNCDSMENAFFNPSITSVTVGGVFNECSNLKKVVIGEKIIRFGDNTSMQSFCTHTQNLLEVVFPPNIISLKGSYPFSSSQGETPKRCKVYLTSETPPELGSALTDNMFRNRRITIYVPADSVETYKAAEFFANDAAIINAIPDDWDNPYK